MKWFTVSMTKHKIVFTALPPISVYRTNQACINDTPSILPAWKGGATLRLDALVLGSLVF